MTDDNEKIQVDARVVLQINDGFYNPIAKGTITSNKRVPSSNPDSVHGVDHMVPNTEIIELLFDGIKTLVDRSVEDYLAHGEVITSIEFRDWVRKMGEWVAGSEVY